MKGLAIAVSLALSASALLADSAQERLKEAASVMDEIANAPDKGIPQDTMSKAHCVVILPNVKKAAFVVGGEYGRGFATCRTSGGSGWSAPAAMKMEGGSVGFQIGGSSTDLILLVMNERGMDKLLQDKFTLGADASVAAGPVGRTASAATDARLDAEILAWSRSKGLFAGVALKGATLRPDSEQNEELYGKKMHSREIITSATPVPAAASGLIAALGKFSMNKEGSSDRIRK
jgi:lipid-binding SYLF domain-containing protein